MKLHRHNHNRLQIETLEDRTTPSAVTALPGDGFCPAAPTDQPPVLSAFEIKDFSFGVENPTTIGSATGGDPTSASEPVLQYKFETVLITKIDWSGPGDEGPEESIGAGKIKFNEFTIEASDPVLAGWDQVTNNDAAFADQAPVPAAVDAFIYFETAGWDVKQNVKV